MLAAGLFEYNFGDSEFLMLFLMLVTLPFADGPPRRGVSRRCRDGLRERRVRHALKGDALHPIETNTLVPSPRPSPQSPALVPSPDLSPSPQTLSEDYVRFARASARSEASNTMSAEIRVRQRKSPGAHTR